MNLYIFNPEAKNADKLRNKVKNYLAHLDLEGEFVEAKKKEDVAIIATEALKGNIDTIVAIGGDGIVNRIIQIIAGQDISMGVIPIGNTNFLANFLGINNWRKGCEVLVKKEYLNLNLGIINDKKYFISSVELDSNDSENKKIWKRILRKKKLREYVSTTITTKNINAGLKIQAETSSIMISTIPFPLPEGMTLKKAMEREELNVIIKSKPKEAKNGIDEITVLAGKEIEISSKKKLNIMTDGEEYGKNNAIIKIVPKALRVILPKERI